MHNMTVTLHNTYQLGMFTLLQYIFITNMLSILFDVLCRLFVKCQTEVFCVVCGDYRLVQKI